LKFSAFKLCLGGIGGNPPDRGLEAIRVRQSAKVGDPGAELDAAPSTKPGSRGTLFGQHGRIQNDSTQVADTGLPPARWGGAFGAVLWGKVVGKVGGIYDSEHMSAFNSRDAKFQGTCSCIWEVFIPLPAGTSKQRGTGPCCRCGYNCKDPDSSPCRWEKKEIKQKKTSRGKKGEERVTVTGRTNQGGRIQQPRDGRFLLGRYGEKGNWTKVGCRGEGRSRVTFNVRRGGKINAVCNLETVRSSRPRELQGGKGIKLSPAGMRRRKKQRT